ncbi:sensor histidine kinase [Granulicella arctica]|uniref:sensor histidine kinase n=1 Tax=Granulicella arctica TaxID=940613 RepID=UPI0021E0A30D|nr:sensor histidine kinase [Granulicella arctica]
MSCFGLDPGRSLQQHLLRTWTSENGLPQNSIRAMLETHDGFLWIGTRGGLARFDGATFTTWKVGQADSIPSDSITGLAEDEDGSLWISSDNGLTQYRGGHFHTFGVADGLPAASVWRIASDSRGGVWAVTWQSQLFHFDGRRVQLFPTQVLKLPEEVNALIEDRQGMLWIATFQGLLAFNPSSGFKQFTKANGLAGTRTYALAVGCTGALWIAGDGGLTRYDGGRFTVLPLPGLPTATILALDSNCTNNAIWTGSTGQGLFRMTPQGIERMRAREGLVSNELWMLYFSREGSLWLGANDGLNQLSDGSVTSYRTGKGTSQSTSCMQRSQSVEGELWFGCGRYSFHVSGDRLLPIALGTAAQQASSSGNTSRETKGQEVIPLWVRSYRRGSQGMVFVNKQGRAVLRDGAVEQHLPRIPWHSVGTMLIGRDGTIWVAGSEIGVRAYPPHGPSRAFTSADGLDDNNVSALAEDASGSIWVGTLSGLDIIRHSIPSRVLGSVHVTSIETSTDGSAWAGSESGLIYVPPGLGTARLFAQRDNLPTSVIVGLAADTEGNLWLSTQQGVIRVRKSNLLASDTHALPVIFGTADGFHNALSRPNSAFFSKHGDLWFVTPDEIATIDPRKTQSSPPTPNFVDEIILDDGDVIIPTNGPLIIPPGRHRLEIRYTLPELQISRRIHFRYRLKGWDKEWRRADTLRYATYTGIPPGNYSFLVESSDGYDHWNSIPSVLPIRIIPYFYQTLWFLSLLAFSVAGCFWQLHRMRVARVSSQMNVRMLERARIARELHDTLLQGVLGVSMQMYAASQQAGGTTYPSSLLDNASQRLREIAEQSRQAVEGLRSSLTSPGLLKSSLVKNIRAMNLPPGFHPKVHCAGQPQVLAPAVQKEVEQIVGEAITNSVRHSGADLIRVDVIYQTLHLFVSITDSGCGIQANLSELSHHGHWGILGMRERARAIGGKLHISPNAPSGTVVELSIAGKAAYLHFSGNGVNATGKSD